MMPVGPVGKYSQQAVCISTTLPCPTATIAIVSSSVCASIVLFVRALRTDKTPLQATFTWPGQYLHLFSS